MAKKVYDEPIGRDTDWGGDESTGGLPVAGNRVQDFLKDELDGKIGILHYDEKNNRYLAFANAESRDKYVEDDTLMDLILGVFDAPFNYSAEIKLLSKPDNAVLMGATGNYIRFTFDTVNKNGQSVMEDVMCTYTFRRGSNKRVVTEKYKYGQSVSFNVDKYLLEGTNTVTIGITGQTSYAATTMGVTFQVVNLSLSNENTEEIITTRYGATSEVEVLYKIAGTGTKTVEWYLDGELLPWIPNDESNETSVTKLRTIPLEGLSHGVHTLQMRARVTVNGEDFYSNLLYREIMVFDGSSLAPQIAVALEFGAGESIKRAGETLTVGGIEQYTVLPLTIGVNNPTNAAVTNVTVSLAGTVMGVLEGKNGEALGYELLLPESGPMMLGLAAGETLREIQLEIDPTSTTLREITDNLALNLRAKGKSNNSADKATWESCGHSATFDGFQWNDVSGWGDSGLYIANGNSVSVDITPLDFQRRDRGKTIDLFFSSRAVEDNDAILCDLRGSTGSGIVITASSINVITSAGNTLQCKFKSEEDTRATIVINRTSGEDANMLYIFMNGLLSRAMALAASESIRSDARLAFRGSADAEMILKQAMVYDSALSRDQVLNNYMLYQDSSYQMLSLYHRNDVEDGSQLSVEKLAAMVPVMVITGDIPTLENTKDKNEQITVDVEYINMQDPTLSFTMTDAAMRPQGTSSMGYPKKNFRLYTKKNTATKVYNHMGQLLPDKLYSFTAKAQPVPTWCLKADYAESSGTHNTGIARLWNTVLFNATVGGEYVFRTRAQQAAYENDYPYDVRTTVDGFPCLLFYKLTESSNPVFIGKYNFNNDKSTESVFGFKDIPGFDNTHMQCWEILNNGNEIALFTDVSNFDSQWESAFESRYPDGSITEYGDGRSTLTELKDLCLWINSTKDDPEKFKAEKRDHLDLYKIAAYYIYLMRFGGVDQPVKNGMLTSEDGIHYYFVNYDNDTINGLSNDGVLAYDPTIDRQSLDPKYENVFAYAGHESVLWNNLEADEEFMELVKVVDRALYAAGLSYANVIDMFDNKQAGMWCEKVYNRDAQYKYIDPWINSSINNLFMLQGSRQSHRRWWLSQRFSLYDAKYVSGEYKSKVIETKLANAPAGLEFDVTAGRSMEYGWGANDVVMQSGVALDKGGTHTFTTLSNLNLGDPIRIYSATNVRGVDLHNFLPFMATLDISSVSDEVSGTKFNSLVLGVDVATDTRRNRALSSISGLAKASRLEELDIRGCEGITSLDLSSHRYFRKLLAQGSGLTEVRLANGAPVAELRLPDTMSAVELVNLPQLSMSGFKLDSVVNLKSIRIEGCPRMSAGVQDFVNNWFETKQTPNEECSLRISGIDWTDADINVLLAYGRLGTLSLKGRISLSEAPTPEQMAQLQSVYGSSCFSKNAELSISAPDALYIVAPASQLAGTPKPLAPNVVTAVFSQNLGALKLQVQGSIPAGVHVEIRGNYGDADYEEIMSAYGGPVAWVWDDERTWARTVTFVLLHIPSEGATTSITQSMTIAARTYPGSNSTIEGPVRVSPGAVTQYDFNPVSSAPINGEYHLVWSILAPSGSGLIDISSSVEIVSQTDSYVKIKVAEAVEEGDFRLQCTAVANCDNINPAQVSKSISCLDEETIMTSSTNPAVMRICYDAGWCASPNKMTKTEARLVTDIGTKFQNNYALETFTEFQYFTSVISIDNAFYSSRKLKEIVLPESLNTIGNSSFEYCRALTKINIPKNVTSLGHMAFFSCSNLYTIEYNAIEAASNGSRIFEGVSDDVNILIGDSVRVLPGFLPWSKGLTHISLPDSVESIGGGAFNGCTGLTEITMGASLKTIGNNAFKNCKALSKVNIPDSLESIGNYAFQYCTALSKIDLPDSLTSIGEYAFDGCSELMEITIPENITTLGLGMLGVCNKLKKVTYNAYNIIKFTSASYSPFISRPIETIIIGDKVTKIPDYICFGCTKLTSIEWPSAPTSIGYDAFYGCSALTEITIPDSVATIGSSAFRECSSLADVKLPSNLTTLSSQAFALCNSLTAINIPEGVKEISSTFDGCQGLLEVVLPSTVTSFIGSPFSGCINLSRIICKAHGAPTASSGSTFGSSDSSYAGRNTYDQGVNKLYVPVGATGYDTGRWLDPLQDATKCGFTLVETDDFDNI